MHRGCVAAGEVQCDGCGRTIEHAERYLAIEDEEGMALRYCVDCCLNKGYAHYKSEKGDLTLTFFSE